MTHPIVLFDGVCNLCNSSVQWLIKRDPDGRFRYASLQSQAAYDVLSAHLTKAEIEALPDAIVLVDEAGVHTCSTAVIRIAGKLGLPWRILGAALLIPAVVRDTAYRIVARNRYRWFGHKEACLVPTPDVAERFLDADEPTRHIEFRDPT
jgi:predicted DCC family thiol-disulfide oxidoreductase YuxK